MRLSLLALLAAGADAQGGDGTTDFTVTLAPDITVTVPPDTQLVTTTTAGTADGTGGSDDGKIICTEAECAAKALELGITVPLNAAAHPTKGCFFKNNPGILRGGGHRRGNVPRGSAGGAGGGCGATQALQLPPPPPLQQPRRSRTDATGTMPNVARECAAWTTSAPWKKLPDGSPCRQDDDAMCASDYCAAPNAGTAEHVCCSSLGKAWSDKGPTEGYVCLRATGAACEGDSALCAGICNMDDVCADEKIEPGESCREDEDDMCATEVCSRGEESANSQFICCPSGEKVYSALAGGDICANADDAPVPDLVTTTTMSTEASPVEVTEPTDPADGGEITDPTDVGESSTSATDPATTTTEFWGTTTTTTPEFEGVHTPPASEPSSRLNEMGAAPRCGGRVVATIAIFVLHLVL